MSEQDNLTFSDLLQPIAIMIGISTVINVILYYIGVTLDAFGPGIAIVMGNPLAVFNVILLSVISPIVASFLFKFLYNKNPEGAMKTFVIISIVVFVLFFFQPFLAIQQANTLTIVFLEIMHVVVAGAVIGVLYKTIGN